MEYSINEKVKTEDGVGIILSKKRYISGDYSYKVKLENGEINGYLISEITRIKSN